MDGYRCNVLGMCICSGYASCVIYVHTYEISSELCVLFLLFLSWWCEEFQQSFCIYWDDYINFLLYFLVHIFISNTTPTLHSLNKTNLVQMCNSLNMSLDFIFCYFVYLGSISQNKLPVIFFLLIFFPCLVLRVCWPHRTLTWWFLFFYSLEGFV